MQLTGRTAVVTGGTRGLGRAIAFAFAEAGADVVVASRKADACEEVAAAIAAATGRETMGFPCHVGEWEQVDALADTAYERFGKVDVLVNNAGMSPLYPNLVDVTEALYDKTFGVNVKGAFRLAAVVGARMAAGDGGSIINISSNGSLRPEPGFLPYAMAKAALNTMTLGLAHAYGPKVRVNAIIPGGFLTSISEAWDPEENARDITRPALKRWGQPDEIVGAALYFASDASSYTTGALLTVDGGMP